MQIAIENCFRSSNFLILFRLRSEHLAFEQSMLRSKKKKKTLIIAYRLCSKSNESKTNPKIKPNQKQYKSIKWSVHREIVNSEIPKRGYSSWAKISSTLRVFIIMILRRKM